MGLSRRLLLAGPGGSLLIPAEEMSTDETLYWQDQAALLDPLAYEFVNGTSQSDTVPTDERWYLVNGWFLKVFDAGGGHWFHRPAHVDHALMLPEGFALETSTSQAGAFWYVCKPSLVTGSDARYATDPRALYFDRLMQLGELTRYQIGHTNTGSGQTDESFPGDFTYGMVMQVSTHDLAWVIFMESGGSGGMNTLNEIADNSRIRFAEDVLFPFNRVTFPEIRTQGVSQSEGAGNVIYCKLPGGW